MNCFSLAKLISNLVDNFFFWRLCVCCCFFLQFFSWKFATRKNLERCSWLQKKNGPKGRPQIFAKIRKGGGQQSFLRVYRYIFSGIFPSISLDVPCGGMYGDVFLIFLFAQILHQTVFRHDALSALWRRLQLSQRPRGKLLKKKTSLPKYHRGLTKKNSNNTINLAPLQACWDPSYTPTKSLSTRDLAVTRDPSKILPVRLLSFPLFSTGFVNWLLSSKIRDRQDLSSLIAWRVFFDFCLFMWRFFD